MRVRVAAPRGLNIRETPSVAARKIGALRHGDIVAVDESRAHKGPIYTWLPLTERAGWIAYESRWGARYVEPVSDDAHPAPRWGNGVVVDMSAWQPRVTPEFFAWADLRGLVHRAVMETGEADPYAHDRIAAARAFGLPIVGGYVWVDLATDPARYIDLALEVIHPRRGHIVALDIERDPGNTRSRARLRGIVDKTVRRLLDAQTRLGFVPVIYSVRGLWDGIYTDAGKPTWLDDPRLRFWVAAPGPGGEPRTAPLADADLPRWWDMARVTLWQYSFRERVPGVSGLVDGNRWRDGGAMR